MPVWTRRVGNDSPLASISASSTDLKRIQTPHSLKRDFSADKTFTTSWSCGTAAAEFKFETKFKRNFSPREASRLKFKPVQEEPSSHCLSSVNYSQRLFQTIIEGFDKIDGWALGAALRHSLGGSNGQAQTQGVSQSAAVGPRKASS